MNSRGLGGIARPSVNSRGPVGIARPSVNSRGPGGIARPSVNRWGPVGSTGPSVSSALLGRLGLCPLNKEGWRQGRIMRQQGESEAPEEGPATER